MGSRGRYGSPTTSEVQALRQGVLHTLASFVNTAAAPCCSLGKDGRKGNKGAISDLACGSRLATIIVAIVVTTGAS